MIRPEPARPGPLAVADLAAIWRHTLAQWSRAQADTCVRNLSATSDALARGDRQTQPASFRPGDLEYLCGAHVVDYQQQPERLDVSRVLHQRQDAERNL